MSLQDDYPWTKPLLVSSAPMRLIALAPLAVAVSRAGGLGFIGAGSDTANLESYLEEAQFLLTTSHPIADSKPGILPIGVGFLNWGADLHTACRVIGKFKPCAVWFFAARTEEQMVEWTKKIRKASPETKIWIQVGTVQSALSLTRSCQPDVLVVQGTDAGGHGLSNGGASIISLLPEVVDSLQAIRGDVQSLPRIVAAGGIMDGRGCAAALALGAEGVCLGTRFLACPEANIAPGYQKAVLQGKDGGTTTMRTGIYDTLRGTTDWPEGYGGRGILNQSYRDSVKGVSVEENRKLYNEALEAGDAGWGEHGRLTTYAGTGVGLVRRVQPAAEIVAEVIQGAQAILGRHAKL